MQDDSVQSDLNESQASQLAQLIQNASKELAAKAVQKPEEEKAPIPVIGDKPSEKAKADDEQESIEETLKKLLESLNEHDLECLKEILIKSLDTVNEHKKKHILDEKHDWEKVVENPKDWEDVSKVIKEVIKKGANEQYQKKGLKKVLEINGHKVVVTYSNKPGEMPKVGNAWVEQPEK